MAKTIQRPNETKVQVSKEVNGIEMGVLEDGTPFLSMRGLTRLCGVSNSHLSDTAKAWLEGRHGATKLGQFLLNAGIAVNESLYAPIPVTKAQGTVQYAFSDRISSLVLEYYAFEADGKNATALNNYRLTSRAGLRLFIYSTLGWDPANLVPQPWRHFHDRVTLVSAPTGFFSVFKESADFVIHSIRGGLKVDDRTVPDISIGSAWADYWKKNKLSAAHGDRVRHDHSYPDYFPQAASNPQEIWVYPVAALPAFRVWLQTEYVQKKFPNYLSTKVLQGALPASAAELMLVEAGAPVPDYLIGATQQARQLSDGKS
jgi:hypothetical protein